MTKPPIIFTNQFTGYLFIDIVNAFAADGYDCSLYAGQVIAGNIQLDKHVKVKSLIEYNRNTGIKRIFTWAWFSIQLFFRLLFTKSDKELFIVTNPPFAPFVGYYLHKLRGFKYHLLVYDVYPDALIQFGKAKKNGFIDKLWSRVNCKIFSKANTVYTLSDNMALLIKNYAPQVRVDVIPNWADTSFIKPVPKSVNPFAVQYNQQDKITVMYSGNMGATHAVEKIADLAFTYKNDPSFGFMLIGDGVKKASIEQIKQDKQLDNLLMLPYQPADVLPFSLATADIGIVTLSIGAEDLSVPSKTYNLLAAGVALLVIASPRSELATLVRSYNCGASFGENETAQIIAFLQDMKTQPDKLLAMKANARRASADFTPANAAKYITSLNSNVPSGN